MYERVRKKCSVLSKKHCKLILPIFISIKHINAYISTCILIVCLFQVSIEAVRQLDERLLESYIEKKSDPIVGSLEPGIYAGYFDWKDCLPPTGTAAH